MSTPLLSAWWDLKSDTEVSTCPWVLSQPNIEDGVRTDRVTRWGTPDVEMLTHETIPEALEAWIDDFWTPPGEPRMRIPRTVTVHGYAPMRVNRADLPDFLDDAIERLEEIHGSPDEIREVEPTPRMKQAARALEDALMADYRPWAMEVAVTVTVDVMVWARERYHDLGKCEWEL